VHGEQETAYCVALPCHRTGARLDISKNGADTDKNFSAYARKMLIDGYVIKVDYSELKAVTAEIQKIGANVNQIAKRVNATGNVYEQDIAEIKGALAEIWRLQRLSLLKAP